MMDRTRLVTVLTIGAVALVAIAYVGFGIATADWTLGCDFGAYQHAAERFLNGQPVYDVSITRTGPCNQFQYPPPFVLLALPFALLGFDLGNAAWIGFLLGCFTLGTAILPVRPGVRIVVFLAGAVSWPLIYGVRIGQVAPILYALFAIGWRGLDRPAITGMAVGLGVLVKLQPVVIVGWMIARRMWSGAAAAVATVVVGSAAAALVGLGAWADMFQILRNVSNALDYPVNVSIGAIGYQHGLGLAGAGLLQTVSIVATLGLVVATALRSSTAAGYLTAVVASQVVSPIIWAHYALILLLPVAWLLEHRQWWAGVIPLCLAWVLLPFMPLDIYPLAFYASLLSVPLVDYRIRSRSEKPAPRSPGAWMYEDLRG